MAMDEDVDHAVGQRVVVRVDPVARRPVEWTDSFRETLRPYRKDLEAPDVDARAGGVDVG
jgi:acyl-CoA thioesterase FadM